MSIRYGVIPAAGRGSRARPYSKSLPKCMLDINGSPNLLKNILIMRDQLCIHEIFIIVGYQGKHIQKYFGDGSKFNVQIKYIKNDNLDKGLAYSILLTKNLVDGNTCCVILADECYINSNHVGLRSIPYQDSIATCGVMRVDDRELIRKNYSVSIDEDYIVGLTEKPQRITNDFLGCGTFLLNPPVFTKLERAFEKSPTGTVDFITFLNDLCQDGEKIRHFTLTGTYVNINDRDSLHLAKYYERARVFDDQTVTMLIYSEGDEEDIAFTIKRYKEIERLDLIYVVLPDDNRIEETITNLEIPIVKCPAHIGFYGEKLKYALERIPGDILILSEADYSFPGRDVNKLLNYLREADMVIGTRTTRQLIEQGSEMRGIVRVGNIILAKILEMLWWNFECRFSDVGCTFRAIWKSDFEKIKSRLVSRGPEFSVEMMIEALKARQRVIEIPVNYFSRSRSMFRKYQNFWTFLRMLFLICRKTLSRFHNSEDGF